MTETAAQLDIAALIADTEEEILRLVQDRDPSTHGVPQAINAGDMLFSLSRVALHRLTSLGFSDAKVLRLMRLYDETCVALCEGQFLDIWAGDQDEPLSVELYFDMIGRKTAALIAASIEAGALLATDDEAIVSRYRAF